MRSYYVIFDNILLRDPRHAGYTRLEASSGPELLERVKERYELHHPACIIQLWSHEPGHLNHPIRLDTLSVIPEGHEFIYIKAIPKRT
jgi:hypothetical protein